MSRVTKRVRSIVRAPFKLVGYDLQRVSLPRQRSQPDPDVIAASVRQRGARKVQYGCGRTFFGDGWLNVDFRRASPPPGRLFHRMDLTGPHPFPDEFFDYGFSEDFIEHLTQEQSLRFLIEARRTLRPGGVLRLTFPGLEGVLRHHYVPPSYENRAQQPSRFTASGDISTFIPRRAWKSSHPMSASRTSSIAPLVIHRMRNWSVSISDRPRKT